MSVAREDLPGPGGLNENRAADVPHSRPQQPNTGFHAVFDPNLALISQYVKTQKEVPALVRVVDIAGIVQYVPALL